MIIPNIWKNKKCPKPPTSIFHHGLPQSTNNFRWSNVMTPNDAYIDLHTIDLNKIHGKRKQSMRNGFACDLCIAENNYVSIGFCEVRINVCVKLVPPRCLLVWMDGWHNLLILFIYIYSNQPKWHWKHKSDEMLSLLVIRILPNRDCIAIPRLPTFYLFFRYHVFALYDQIIIYIPTW